MSNNQSNRLNNVVMDQTLFILENYVEFMTIVGNTQAQITRQQQEMVRKMNVLITELRRHQVVDSLSENILSSLGSLGETNSSSTANNDAREGSPRERFRSRFEQETRNINRELFRVPSRSGNSRNSSLFGRPVRGSHSRSPALRSRSRSRNSSNTENMGSINQQQPTQSPFNFGNSSNGNNSTTNRANPFASNTSGILLNFEQVFPFGQRSNVTTTGTTFQTPFGGNLFENVPIFPSPEQVETATTSMHFQDISNPINTSCPITMETFSPQQIVVKINHCGHIFNQVHLHSWFRSHVRCPVCRYDIREDISGNSTSTEERTNSTPTNSLLSSNIFFTPLNSISESRENEETTTSPPAAGGSDTEQQSGDELSSISRLLLQALMAPSTSRNDTQQSTSLISPLNTSSMQTTTIPVSWSHIIPGVPLSPLTFTQQTTVNPSTGSRNNETSPSSDTQEAHGSDDEVLSQD